MKTFALIVLSTLLLFAACTPRQEETATIGRLHILGSESQAVVLRLQAAEFERLYPEAKLSLAATSTRDAIVQLLNDSVRFICIDRDLNAEEKAVAAKAEIELERVHMAEDALAFIVHPENPAREISEQGIRNILDGTARTWNNVPGSTWSGPVLLACTGKNSGPYELLTKTFFKLAGELPLSCRADSQSATVQYVAANPHAIGIVPVSAVRDTALGVRILKVEALDSASGTRSFVALHQANIYLGKYPWHYPVLVYFSTARGRLTSGFCTFMASGPGQKLFQSAGLVPKTQPVRLVKLNEE